MIRLVNTTQDEFFFQISYHIGRHLVSIKMKEIIKVEYKVSVRVGREGFIVPIMWHPFNNINIIMYTQYVIAYYFIMYYNTEVRIIATICNK